LAGRQCFQKPVRLIDRLGANERTAGAVRLRILCDTLPFRIGDWLGAAGTTSRDSDGVEFASKNQRFRILRTLVVGAGAVGGYFGGRLAQAGRDVTLLVRAKRAEEINTKGLQIVSPYGDLTLHPKVATANQINSPYDLILLAVKSYALSSAMNDFAPAVGPETMILPVLNGMRHIDLLTARFGRNAVLGGVCLVATEIDQEGRIQQLTKLQSITYGELDGESTQRLQKLDETLGGASFHASSSNQIMRDMWEKWVLLATVGSITCLMCGNIGEIAAIPGGCDLSLAALRECSGIASACGYPQSDAFLEKQTGNLTTQGSNMTSSMYRDLKKGAPVEVDTILGDLLEHGHKYGLKTPILQAAFVSLSIYQNGLDRAMAATNVPNAYVRGSFFRRLWSPPPGKS
jgi:2-dehydropantoate 2-reductase